MTNNGNTALTAAALHGNIAVAELVMGSTALPLDHQDACGQTALHNAIAGGNPDVVRLLLGRGASVWCKDKVGYVYSAIRFYL